MSDAEETFAELHHRLRVNRNDALSEIFCTKTGRLKDKYRKFKNHSWYIVGDIYFHKGEFNRAIKYFKKSLLHNAGDWVAWLALGNSYSAAKKYKSALTAYANGLRVRPRHSGLRYNYANTLWDLGRKYEAAAIYQKLKRVKNKEVAELSAKTFATYKRFWKN